MSDATTTQGQAWDQLARERLGSEFAMHKLLAANWAGRGVLLFSGDIRLTVPEQDGQPEKNIRHSLPPWKR